MTLYPRLTPFHSQSGCEHSLMHKNFLTLSLSLFSFDILLRFIQAWTPLETSCESRTQHGICMCVCVWSTAVLLPFCDTGHFLLTQMSLSLTTSDSQTHVHTHADVHLSCPGLQWAYQQSNSLHNWSATKSLTTTESQTQPHTCTQSHTYSHTHNTLLLVRL